VAKYFKELERPKAVPTVAAEEPNAKPATNSTSGSSSSEAEQNPPISTLGDLVVAEAVERVYGRPGPASKCQEHTEQIRAKVEIGLTAQRIYQDLIAEVQFTGPINRLNVSFAGSKRLLPHRCAEWKCSPAKKPKWISAVAPRSSARMDESADRGFSALS